MTPALAVALLWVLFAGTHFGLSSDRARAALVERLGEVGFLVLFYAVASACLTALVMGGVWLIGFFITGSVVFGVSAWRRSRRIAARLPR